VTHMPGRQMQHSHHPADACVLADALLQAVEESRMGLMEDKVGVLRAIWFPSCAMPWPSHACNGTNSVLA
jgi:hypothetical protein